MTSERLHKSICAAAVFEALKGLLVLVAGFRLLHLLHKDAHMRVWEFISHVHLNPAQKYPKIFIELADQVTDSKLWFFASLALIYSAFRFIEGYGLWKEKTWAKWLATISGTIYVPLEIYEIWMKVSFVRISALAINMAVLMAVAYALAVERRAVSKRAPSSFHP